MNYMDQQFVKDESAYLAALITFEQPFSEIKKLDRHGWQDWDEEKPLGIVDRKAVLNVLQGVIDHKVSATDIHKWAVELFDRETIDYESGYASVLSVILNALATEHHPNVLAIDIAKAQEYIDEILNAQYVLEES